jgi:hypothetical protein
MALNDHILRQNKSKEIDINSILYANERVGSQLTTLGSALDYIIAHLYPNYIGTYPTQGDLPASANANDYAWIENDGTGSGSGWVFTNLDGTETWTKRYDVDWSRDSILSDVESITNPLYLFANGKAGGQEFFGGSQTGENIYLNANSADDTGKIISRNDISFDTDNENDIGELLSRVKDFYIAGSLRDGTSTITVAQLQTALDHLTRSDNPHSVDYDQLINKLGTITVDGDVSGTVDLSASGDKTLTISVGDDSHSHTSATISDLTSAIYSKVASIFQDNDLITYTKDGGSEEIRPTVSNIDTSRITDIDTPTASNKFAVSNGAKYEEKGLDVELTGEVTGTASYNSTTEKVEISTTVENVELAKVSGLDLQGLTFTVDTSFPAVVTANAHNLQNSTQIYIKSISGDIDGNFGITVLDANSFTINTSVASPTSGYYIPDNAQFLFDSSTSTWKVRREFDELTHNELSGREDTDSHSWAVALNGRDSGQRIFGGLNASEKLILSSTFHSTKGVIEFEDVLQPAANNSVDIGSANFKIKDLYIAGEAKGLRLENVTSNPTPSGLTRGRAYWNTGENKAYIDTGLALVPLASSNLPKKNVTLTNESTKTVDVSDALGFGAVAGDYVWSLYKVSTSEQVHAPITVINATQIQVNINTPFTGDFVFKGI